MSVVLRLKDGKTNSHIDQYPLALLIEDGYLGVSINTTHPDGFENMRELNEAISLHMYTLPKNEKGITEYMGITGRESINPDEVRVFLKAKGSLYLDEQKIDSGSEFIHL